MTSDGLEFVRGILVGATITAVEKSDEDDLVLQIRRPDGTLHELRALMFGPRFLGLDEAPRRHHPLCAHFLSGHRDEVPCDCGVWA